MSTSDKLIYLNGTKQALKESINNLGGDITSETTFREYAQELDNIYDNLPKTTGEDTNLSLNTLKGKMNIIPKGDTQQTQYSGINLFQAKLVTTTDNGITVTNNNNGTFTINGTNTSSSLTTFRLDQSTQNGVDNLQNYEDGTYTLDLGIQNENIQITLMQVNTWQQFIATGMNVRLKSGAITGATGMFIYIAIKGSATINNVVIKPMFVKGSYTTSTIPSFEPYVGGTASPNPTYPQDIEVVTGTQDVKVENVNLCKNAIVNATSGAYVDILYVDMDLKPNTTYTISFIGATNNKIYLNENITTPQYITCTGNRQSLTFTTKSSLDKNNSQQYKASANGWILFKNNSSNTETPSFDNVQIEYGSTTTTYTPHKEQTQTLSLGDIELCKIGNYKDYLYKTSGKNKLKNNATTQTIKGVTFTKYDDGSVKVSGTATSNIQYDLLTSNDNIQISSGNYYLSGCPSGGTGETYRLVIGVNGTLYGEYGSGRALTLNSGVLTSYIYLASGTSVNNLIYKPMLNEGSTALPYEPYGTGNWYKKEYVYKIANKTNWSVDNVASNNRAVISLSGNGFPYSSDIGYASANAISNNFIGMSQFNQASTTEINNIAINNANMYIKFADTINTTTLVKTQLDSMTSLEVYYVLATPNDIQITNTNLIEQLDNLEKMYSYNGTTNISSSGSLPMILNVSAIKGES